MKPMCLASLVGLSVFLAVSGVVSAGETPTLEERLWPIARQQRALLPGEKCRIIKEFRLIAVGPGLGEDATVLAAVLDCQFHDGGPFFEDVRVWPIMELSERACKAGYDKVKGAEERFDEFVKRKFKALDKKCEMAHVVAYDKQPEDWRTVGLLNAALIESYFRGEPRQSLEAAVRQFAADNLMKANLRKEDKPTWDSVVKAIEGGVPVILGNKQGLKVAIGYYQGENERALFLYDPAKAQRRVATGAELAKGKPKIDMTAIKDPRILKAIADEHERKRVVDYRVDLSGDLPPGFVAKPWAEVQDCTATYISDWAPDIETAYKELKGYLDSKDPSEEGK